VTRGEQRRRVAAARVARLATVGRDGAPHLVPVCFVLAGDTLYSAVDRKPKRTARLRRLENVRAQPRASVLVDGWDEDWTRLWWVRLDGEGRVLEDGAERERALALLGEKYAQYRDAPPGGPVLALDVRAWRSWSAADAELS
jgi:PPOX class probable F420-dependent enzyme